MATNQVSAQPRGLPDSRWGPEHVRVHTAEADGVTPFERFAASRTAARLKRLLRHLRSVKRLAAYLAERVGTDPVVVGRYQPHLVAALEKDLAGTAYNTENAINLIDSALD